jgi:hypothetical protein
LCQFCEWIVCRILGHQRIVSSVQV